jgi:xylulose-5-phosphate/fructose-6-phosphate phosphoketolase
VIGDGESETCPLEDSWTGAGVAEAPRKLGDFFRDIFRLNPMKFCIFCPDETDSNRLHAVLEATKCCCIAETVSIDDELSPDGRVMEVLSEHCCEGWLEGYLLAGRHGMWSSYEAFAQIAEAALYPYFWCVGDVFRWQEFRHVKTCPVDPVCQPIP